MSVKYALFIFLGFSFIIFTLSLFWTFLSWVVIILVFSPFMYIALKVFIINRGKRLILSERKGQLERYKRHKRVIPEYAYSGSLKELNDKLIGIRPDVIRIGNYAHQHPTDEEAQAQAREIIGRYKALKFARNKAQERAKVSY